MGSSTLAWDHLTSQRISLGEARGRGELDTMQNIKPDVIPLLKGLETWSGVCSINGTDSGADELDGI